MASVEEVIKTLAEITVESPPKSKINILYFTMTLLNKDAKELHFEILNVFLKICYQGYHYRFCDKYSGCEHYYWSKRYRPLCRIPVDLHDTEKLCDYAQFNFDELAKIADKFLPYLEECLEVMGTDTLLELFNGGQHSTYTRDSYTGAKTETTLREQIEFTKYLKNSTVKKCI